MVIKFMPKHQIWQMLKCAHILSLSMHSHTGNVYCGAVLNVLVSIFLTKKQLKNMTKIHPLLGFTFTTSLDVVLLMVEFHWKIRTYVTCVKKNLYQIHLQNIHQKRASDDGDNHIKFLYQFIHTSHPKVGLSSATYAHTWYKSLWWNAMHSLQTTWIVSICSLSPWLWWEGSIKIW